VECSISAVDNFVKNKFLYTANDIKLTLCTEM
jgi:hypothetical protein